MGLLEDFIINVEKLQAQLRDIRSGALSLNNKTPHARITIEQLHERWKSFQIDADEATNLLDNVVTSSHNSPQEEEAKTTTTTATQAQKKNEDESRMVLEVKPWDSYTDMDELETQVRSIAKDGLRWGASDLVRVVYGLKKLRIVAFIRNDSHIAEEDLQEEIEAIQQHVQSADIVLHEERRIEAPTASSFVSKSDEAEKRSMEAVVENAQQLSSFSRVVLDVKPWSDLTDMAGVEEKVRSIDKEGKLKWGPSELLPVAYGLNLLRIAAFIQEDFISPCELEQEIESLASQIQRVDIVSVIQVPKKLQTAATTAAEPQIDMMSGWDDDDDDGSDGS